MYEIRNHDAHLFAPLYEADREEARRDHVEEAVYALAKDSDELADMIAGLPDSAEDLTEIVSEALAADTPEAWESAKLLLGALMDRALGREIERRLA